MSRLDTDQADRDALTDQRIERDRQREPGPREHRHPRCIARGVFQAAVIDSVNRAQDTSIGATLCPRCNGPVFVPADSDREIIDCADATCAARLITRRHLDGSVSVIEVLEVARLAAAIAAIRETP